MEWIKVTDSLPGFDVEVLVYYAIEKDKKSKDADKFHHYIEIAHIQTITEGKGYKSADWVDSNYNAVRPTHWMHLPEKPKI